MKTKLVYLVRHGEADWPNWRGDDDERPLTSKGEEEMKRMAKFLRRGGAKPLAILSSPIIRAAQTAMIFASEFSLEVAPEEKLRRGFGAPQFEKILTPFDGGEIMLVGHEPDLSDTIRAVTGGAVAMSKGCVALLQTFDTAQPARLRWLIPPRVTGKR